MFFARDGCEVPQVQQQRMATTLPVASMTFSLPTKVGFQRPPFCSIGASSAAASTSTGALPPTHFGAALKEEATGIAFPGEVCVLSSRNCPKLAGVG